MDTTGTARPRRRWRRVLAEALAALALLAVAALVAWPELRSAALFVVAPRVARDASTVRLARGDVQVTLIGTIHGRHLSTPEYGLAHLKAALVHLKPALVLVEARPDEVARGRWGDGPIEMPFVALWARALSLPVDGIDWWTPRGPGGRRTDDERDDRIFRNLQGRLPAAGAVLVTVGYSHVPEQVARLIAAGFVTVPLDDADKQALFTPLDEPFAYPAGMAAAIRQRIADCEAQAATAEASFADDLRDVAAARRAYLDVIERTGEATPRR